jgi:hypothetical protein
MPTRAARRASRRGRLLVAAAIASLIAASAAACGEDDFKNNPRPPAQIEVSANVTKQRVQISPSKFGAGLVNFTVANLSEAPIRFSVTGPKRASTVEIQPGAPDYLKMNLTEGTYEATASRPRIRSATIRVGPERQSSQNELLLP